MSNTDKIIEINQTNQIQISNTSIDKFKLNQFSINNETSKIITLISKIDEVEKILNKNFYFISKDKLVQLLKVLSALSVETSNVIPLNNIINSLYDIFKDGKLEIHEIPLLIRILYEIVLKQNITNISFANFSLLLKLLIIILVELDIIKLNSSDVKIINALIDTSLELLSIQIYIPTKENLTMCCM
jgi:hypothetical protein